MKSTSFFLRRRMSGSDHPQIIPNQKKEETVDSKSPQSEGAAAEERERRKEKPQHAAADHQAESPEQLIKQKDEETDRATVSQRELSEHDDGFKTPTSSGHRIPVITQCPPAPIKLRPPPSKLKRKAASPSVTSPSIQPDEVESIFSPIDQDDAQRHKIKKARAESSDAQ